MLLAVSQVLPSYLAPHSHHRRQVSEVGNPLDLESFALERVILELRYAPAYLHWDRAGKLWTGARLLWPTLRMVGAEPAATRFLLGRKYSLECTLERLSLVAHQPEVDLSSFADLCSQFARLALETLEVPELSRVGLRHLFFREFENEAKASAAFASTGLLAIPPGPQFGIDAPLSHLQVAARWEDETLGATFNLKVEERTFNFEPPNQFPDIEPVHKETVGVVLDIDQFSTSVVSPGQFDADNWMKQARYALTRDTPAFFGA